MKAAPKREPIAKDELVEDTEELDADERSAMELVIANLLGGDGTNKSIVFRLCCCNSRRKPSQLRPPFFRKKLPNLNSSTLTLLKQTVNQRALKCMKDHNVSVVPKFGKKGYLITFEKNPHFAEKETHASFPFPLSRLVGLEQLIQLERAKEDGGHLLPGAELIVQGAAPLLSRPEVAEVVLDNISKGIRYQFVFPLNAPGNITDALSTLLLTGRSDGKTIEQNIERVGDGLEIYLSNSVWPFVVSVHNSRHDREAVSYLRIPDSEYLLELYRGENAYALAAEVRLGLMGSSNDSDGLGWMRSETDDLFQRHLFDDLLRRLHPPPKRPIQDRLRVLLFGSAVGS